MEIKISVDNKEVREFAVRFPRLMQKTIDKSLLQSALEVQNRAKLYAPYQTGNLRRSFSEPRNIVKRGNVIQIGTHLDYGQKLEEAPEGKYTPRQGGRIPFLKPALEDSVQAIEDIFEKNIKQILP